MAPLTVRPLPLHSMIRLPLEEAPSPPVEAREARKSIGTLAPILLLLALTPLVVAPGFLFPYVVPKAVFFRTLVEIGLAGAIALVLTRPTRLDGRDPVFRALLGFLAVGVLSAALGRAPVHSVFSDVARMWGLFTWFHFALYYLLLRSLSGERAWDRLLQATVGVSWGVCAWSVAELTGAVLHGAPGAALPRLASTTGNPGYLGAYLLLAAGISLHLLFRARSRGAQVMYGAGLALQIVVAFLTRDRTVWVCAAAVAVWAVGWLVLHSGSRRRRGRIAGTLAVAGALIVVGIAAAELGWLAAVPGLDRLTEMGWSGDIRFAFWRAALRVAVHHPVLGIGMENANSAIQAVGGAAIARNPGFITDRVHNAYLGAFVEGGAVGLLAYLAIWGAVLLSLVRALRRGALDFRSFLALSGAVVAYLVYLGLWFEDWNSLPVALTIAAYAGTLATGAPVVSFSARVERVRPISRLLIAGFWILLAGSVFVHGAKVLWTSRVQAKALASPSLAERLALHRRALDQRLVGGSTVVYTFANDLTNLTDALLARDPARAPVAEFDRTLDAALGADAFALDIQPQEPALYTARARFLYSAARVHRSAPALQAAAEAANATLALAPSDVQARLLLARIDLSGGETERAEGAVAEARRLYPHFGTIGEVEARVRLARGDSVGAARSLTHALADTLPAAPEPSLVLKLGRAMELGGRRSVAAELYRAYLVADSVGEWGAGRIVAGGRLAISELRAGRPRSAAAAARLLLRHSPDPQPAMQRFLEDLRAGRGSAWADSAAIPLQVRVRR